MPIGNYGASLSGMWDYMFGDEEADKVPNQPGSGQGSPAATQGTPQSRTVSVAELFGGEPGANTENSPPPQGISQEYIDQIAAGGQGEFDQYGNFYPDSQKTSETMYRLDPRTGTFQQGANYQSAGGVQSLTPLPGAGAGLAAKTAIAAANPGSVFNTLGRNVGNDPAQSIVDPNQQNANQIAYDQKQQMTPDQTLAENQKILENNKAPVSQEQTQVAQGEQELPKKPQQSGWWADTVDGETQERGFQNVFNFV
jgi:hypothetical protein